MFLWYTVLCGFAFTQKQLMRRGLRGQGRARLGTVLQSPAVARQPWCRNAEAAQAGAGSRYSRPTLAPAPASPASALPLRRMNAVSTSAGDQSRKARSYANKRNSA